MKNRALWTVITIGLFAFVGCKSEPPEFEVEAGEFWRFEDAYENGLPIDEWREWPFCSVEQRSFKGVPIAVVQVSTPNSYGNTFHLHIYYKANKEDSASREWRECLRFSARSYWELRTVFDEDNDQFTIIGVVPSDKSEEELLVRRRFHDSFAYYIPEHG